MRSMLVEFLCFSALVAEAVSLTPDWGQLQEKSTPRQKAWVQKGKRLLTVGTERDGALVEHVKVAVGTDGVAIDSTDAFAAGAKKVNVCLKTIKERVFPDPTYCMSITVQGPKGARAELFLEGSTLEKKHFYRRHPVTLSGERETISLCTDLPKEMKELHLRFDLLSNGKFRIFDAAFEPVAATMAHAKPKTAAVNAGIRGKRIDRKPELLFYLPFDGSAIAAEARGNKAPLEAKNLEFSPGVKGQALRSSRAAHTVLKYAVKNNLMSDAGTITLWYKPEWKDFREKERNGNPALRRDFLSMARPKKRGGSGAVWFWCWGDLPRGDNSEPKDSYKTTTIELEPGIWYHLAFSWNLSTGEKEIYINGRRSDTVVDNYSPLKLSSLKEAPWMPKPISEFFVGGHEDNEQADGLIDELKIYSSHFSPEEMRKLLTSELPFTFELKTPFLWGGEENTLEFSLRNLRNQPCRLQWMLLDSAGKHVVLSKEIELPVQGVRNVSEKLAAIQPGRYFLRVLLDGRETTEVVTVFHRQTAGALPPGELKLESVETVMPSPALGAERFISIGDVKQRELNGKPYWEAGKNRGDRFAVRFRIPDTKTPYLLEWDYPDDANRTCDIIVQSSRFNPKQNGYQVGYFSGDEYRNTGKMLLQRVVYFPESTDLSLIFMTARQNFPAAVGKIRISRIIGGLPDAGVKAAEPVDGWTRELGIYYEDPAINYGFGVNGSLPDDMEVMIDRLIAYMKFSGQNVLAYPLVWYHGSIGNSYNPRHHRPHFWEAFLTKFDAAGLEFLATMNQNTMPTPNGLVSPEAVENGSLHSSIISIWDTGKPNPGRWHGSPPNFNILHPDVQKHVFANVDRILSSAVRHASFKGIVLHLPRHSMLWFGDLQAGYNDYMIENFEKDTGIKVPVDNKNPMRGKQYAAWLLANAREKWIDWRCRKLADFYRQLAEHLAAARPDLRLVINSMIPVPEVRAEKYTAPDFVAVKNREAGLDPKYYTDMPNVILDQTIYPADYRWRKEMKSCPPAAYARLRVIDTEKAYYELLENAKYPFTHMHDRYWESAIGSTDKKSHWSDKPNALKASWFKEQTWRVTTLNPAGIHAMRHYVLPLRYTDLLGITKGGFLIGTYGMEPYLVPFAKAFRALPAQRFADLEGGSETVKARILNREGETYFYAVNTSDIPAKAGFTIGGKGAITDLVTGKEAGTKIELSLAPYQLRSFRADGDRKLLFEVK